MARDAREFFETLEARADPTKAAGMNASYLFVIEGAGEWNVQVVDGKVTVVEGRADAACTITTSAQTFERIVAGQQNPTTAYMTGKLRVAGDMSQALKLQKLF